MRRSGRARPIPPNILLGITLVVLTGVAFWLLRSYFYAPIEVKDYDSCVEAGNQILLTYPEQCVHKGQSFINPEQNIPKPY